MAHRFNGTGYKMTHAKLTDGGFYSFSTLTPLLAPRSVAIVGASADVKRIGGRPIHFLTAGGFQGEIYPVNPNRAEIQGIKCFASAADLPEVPDVALIAVPAPSVLGALDDLGRLGVRGAIIFSAGFAEVGEEGERQQEEIARIGRQYGMRLIGPNCLGVFNSSIGYYGTFTAALDSGWPIKGRIGIASQSGGYGAHLFTTARNRGIGASRFVTTGNEVDVTVGDVIGWMAEDEDTDVIAVYAEGIHEADRFISALETARAARKPVIVMKAGRSDLGSAAAKSHTASIAGNDAVTDAVLREFGAYRARTTEELLDIAHTATRRIYPVDNSLGIFTISGGAGVLASDVAESIGLSVPEMPAAAQQELLDMVSYSATRNPVDCTGQWANDMSLIRRFMGKMVEEGGYQSILGFFSSVGGSGRAPELREELKAVISEHPDRLYILSVVADKERVREYEADGSIVHEDPSRAVVAAAAMGQIGRAFARPAGAPAPKLASFRLPSATPSEAEAKRLLSESGIECAPEKVCLSADDAVAAAASIGFPVVMKIVSPDILHKSEIGGVLLDVASEKAVRDGFDTLMTRAKSAVPGARLDGVLVAKQLTGGVECILGIQRDPVFGPVAMFGLGGIFVEILQDVVLRRCPFGEDVAEEMIRSIRGAPLLLGARGRKSADIKALAGMLSRLSVYADMAGPTLSSIDLNPVIVLEEGKGAYAVDAVIEISQEDNEDARPAAVAARG